MPQIFRIGPYSIYFWSNESDPLEPIHVHISKVVQLLMPQKIWITSTEKPLSAIIISYSYKHIKKAFLFYRSQQLHDY